MSPPATESRQSFMRPRSPRTRWPRDAHLFHCAPPVSPYFPFSSFHIPSSALLSNSSSFAAFFLLHFNPRFCFILNPSSEVPIIWSHPTSFSHCLQQTFSARYFSPYAPLREVSSVLSSFSSSFLLSSGVRVTLVDSPAFVDSSFPHPGASFTHS